MKKVIYLTALIVFLGITNVASAQWTSPTGSPPNANAPAPLNVSNVTQNKAGTLGVSGFSNFGLSKLFGHVEVGSVPCYQCDTAPKNLTVHFGNIFVPRGKVAVGLSNPDRQVHAHNATGEAGVTISTGSTNWMQIYQPYNQGQLRIGQGSATNNSVSDIATFTAYGNVGIGTTNPANRLTVVSPDQQYSQAIAIDSPYTGQQSSIGFSSAGSQKWQLGRNNDDNFYLWNSPNGRMDLSVENTTGITEINKLKLGEKTSIPFLNQTRLQLARLCNASRVGEMMVVRAPLVSSYTVTPTGYVNDHLVICMTRSMTTSSVSSQQAWNWEKVDLIAVP